MARKLLPWSVASIKMLLLSRGPGKETNSLGSNSPFKTVALWRKEIEPIIFRAVTLNLGLVERNVVVCLKPGQREMSESMWLSRELSDIHLSECVS